MVGNVPRVGGCEQIFDMGQHVALVQGGGGLALLRCCGKLSHMQLLSDKVTDAADKMCQVLERGRLTRDSMLISSRAEVAWRFCYILWKFGNMSQPH